MFDCVPFRRGTLAVENRFEKYHERTTMHKKNKDSADHFEPCIGFP